MAEYIEREAAVNVCSAQYKECLRKSDWCGDTVAWNIGFQIKQLPAADVVEVVRCKDCKHYGWAQEPCHGRTERYCKLNKGLVVISKETFCSYGERRGEDGQKKSL